MNKAKAKADICARCNQKIIVKPAVVDQEHHFHAECFKCTKCRKTINNGICDGWVCYLNEKYYHLECFTCSKCCKIINEDDKLLHSIQGNVFHNKCYKCNSCCKNFGKVISVPFFTVFNVIHNTCFGFIGNIHIRWTVRVCRLFFRTQTNM